MIGVRSTVHRTCYRAWLNHRHDVRSSLHCSCALFSTKVVPSTAKPLATRQSVPAESMNEDPLLQSESINRIQDVVECSSKNKNIIYEAQKSTLLSESTSDGRTAYDSRHERNNLHKYDPQSVTLCYRPTQQLFNLDLHSDKELSIYVKHREELITLKVGEKFKQLVEEAHRETLNNGEKKEVLESIDDLVPQERIPLDYKSLPTYYLRLSKVRLTGLVVCTTVAGYLLAPGAFNILTFTLCTAGTTLLSASANAINQCLERDFDSQMKRTKNRPLVMNQISTSHALAFAGLAGLTGTVVLTLGVNPLTAGLGVLNLFLYTAVYTPMKRHSIVNTWAGSIVGAIPPMMGWAASCNQITAGAWLLGAIMYAWQFPHFCALSWNLRGDYSRAGYHMMAVSHPDLCRRVSLRYSVSMIGLCTLMSYTGVTTWWFAIDSLPVNSYLVYLAWKFYRDGDSGSSRRLFHYTLIHIPAIMVLMLISKNHSNHDKESNSMDSDIENTDNKALEAAKS